MYWRCWIYFYLNEVTVCFRIASYASRALKMLLLDDALRPQAANIVPGVVCDAILHWEDEVCAH